MSQEEVPRWGVNSSYIKAADIKVKLQEHQRQQLSRKLYLSEQNRRQILIGQGQPKMPEQSTSDEGPEESSLIAKELRNGQVQADPVQAPVGLTQRNPHVMPKTNEVYEWNEFSTPMRKVSTLHLDKYLKMAWYFFITLFRYFIKLFYSFHHIFFPFLKGCRLEKGHIVPVLCPIHWKKKKKNSSNQPLLTHKINYYTSIHKSVHLHYCGRHGACTLHLIFIKLH